MTALLWGALLPSLTVAWGAGWLLRRMAPRWGLIDRPGARKVHSAPVPLGGGLAIWLGLVVPLALGQAALAALLAAGHGSTNWAFVARLPWPAIVLEHADGLWHESGRLWVLLGAGSVLVVLGLVDDFRGLDWRARIAAEFAVATFTVSQGYQLAVLSSLPWLAPCVSVLWIVALVNAFNMLDNMDALSGGVALISALALAAVLLAAPEARGGSPQLFVGGLLLVLVGSLAGFLGHNWPPARLFMGDAGAYFVGYLLATTTMLATFAGAGTPRHAILAPVCVLAVPLYDMFTVIVIRLGRGASPFHGDKNHFSHRLVDLGLSKLQAVLTIHLATLATASGALLLYQVNSAGAVVVFLMVVSTLALVGILEVAARRGHE